MPLPLALVIFLSHPIVQALDLAPCPQAVGTLGAKSGMKSSAKEKIFMHQNLAWDLNPTLGRCQPALGLRSSKNKLLRLICPSFFQGYSWTLLQHWGPEIRERQASQPRPEASNGHPREGVFPASLLPLHHPSLHLPPGLPPARTRATLASTSGKVNSSPCRGTAKWHSWEVGGGPLGPMPTLPVLSNYKWNSEDPDLGYTNQREGRQSLGP